MMRERNLADYIGCMIWLFFVFTVVAALAAWELLRWLLI